MLPVIARGAAAAAPSVIEYVSKNQPGVMAKVQNFLGKVTGKPIKSVTNWARQNDNNGAMVIEAAVRSGVTVDMLRMHVPVLSQGELANFVNQLTTLEQDLENVVSDSHPGIINGDIENAARIRLTRNYIRVLKRAFNTNDLDEIWDIITAIGALKEKDLEFVRMIED